MTNYKQMQINSVTAHHVHSFATRTGRSDAKRSPCLCKTVTITS